MLDFELQKQEKQQQQQSGRVRTTGHRLQIDTEKYPNHRRKRKRCSGCYAKYSKHLPPSEAKNKSKQVSTYCSGCPDLPNLCIECYNDHTNI